MLLSAVSVLVVAQSNSEIPEGLMNNPVFTNPIIKFRTTTYKACLSLKFVSGPLHLMALLAQRTEPTPPSKRYSFLAEEQKDTETTPVKLIKNYVNQKRQELFVVVSIKTTTFRVPSPCTSVSCPRLRGWMQQGEPSLGLGTTLVTGTNVTGFP